MGTPTCPALEEALDLRSILAARVRACLVQDTGSHLFTLTVRASCPDAGDLPKEARSQMRWPGALLSELKSKVIFMYLLLPTVLNLEGFLWNTGGFRTIRRWTG